MKIVSSSEMREIDRITSQSFGIPNLTLMENAGSAVAEFVSSRFPSRTVGVVCGKGNNGGDGLVAARKLHEAGKEVRVLLLADSSELKGDAAENFSRLPVAPVLARTSAEMQSDQAKSVLQADVLVDAILGSGFRPPITGLYAEAVAALNSSPSRVVAVDVPSGADADATGEQQGSFVRADAVVTFTAPRPAHIFGGLTPGPIVIFPIGSPEESIVSSLRLNLIAPRDVAPAIAPRPPQSHKGSFGHVLVFGGSTGKAGAAAMAGIAILRAGAGLSTVATPKSALPSVAGFHPEVMTEPLDETEIGSISMRALGYGRIEELVKGKTVVAVGPGISRHPETAEFVRTVVKKFKQPMVVDADGLNAFEGLSQELDGRDRFLVLTPHPGEMARLTGSSTAAVQKDRIATAREFAQKHRVVLVLKGHRTLVAAPDGQVWVNMTGNPGMATGGTGDILTGIASGLMAQNQEDLLRGVIAAVHLHGLAGDVASEKTGEQSLIATDLLAGLPEAFRRTRESAQRGSVELTR